MSLPLYEYGQAVRLIRNVRNDGTYPGKDTGALLLRRGAVGCVYDVGTYLQDQLIYRVHFLEQGCTVGCREEELIPASDPWIPNLFEFRDQVIATRSLAVRGEVVVRQGCTGSIEKVLRDLPGGIQYHVYFGDGRVLQVPETSLAWPMRGREASMSIDPVAGGARYQLLKVAHERFGCAPAALSTPQREQAERIADRQLQLEDAVLHSPEACGVVIPPEQVDDAWAAIVSRYETPDELHRALDDSGLDEAGLRRLLARELKVETVLQRVCAGLPEITDTDVSLYYFNHPERFVRPATRRARHILITVNEAFPENTRSSAWRRINQIAGRAAQATALCRAGAEAFRMPFGDGRREPRPGAPRRALSAAGNLPVRPRRRRDRPGGGIAARLSPGVLRGHPPGRPDVAAGGAAAPARAAPGPSARAAPARMAGRFAAVRPNSRGDAAP